MKPVVITVGPSFPGENLHTDDEQGLGAFSAVGTRRDQGRVGGCYPQVAVAQDGASATTGLHFHKKPIDGTTVRLLASADGKIYANGTACLRADTGAVFANTSPNNLVHFVQEENSNRSYFTNVTDSVSTASYQAVDKTYVYYAIPSYWSNPVTANVNWYFKVTIHVTRAVGASGALNITHTIAFCETGASAGGNRQYEFTGTGYRDSVYGSESLANVPMTAGTNWTATGDGALAANKFTVTDATHVATLRQASGAFAHALLPNTQYELAYTVSGRSGTPTITLSSTVATADTPLSVYTGNHRTTFTTNAAPGDFLLNITTASGAFSLDDISLKTCTGGFTSTNTKLYGNEEDPANPHEGMASGTTPLVKADSLAYPNSDVDSAGAMQIVVTNGATISPANNITFRYGTNGATYLFVPNGSVNEVYTAPATYITLDLSEGALTNNNTNGYPCWFDDRMAQPTVFVDYLPATPAITSVTTNISAGAQLLKLTGTQGASITGVADPTTAGAWAKTGTGFSNADFDHEFGLQSTSPLHIDTNTGKTNTNEVTYTIDATAFPTGKDLSAVTTLSFQGKSGGSENASGNLLTLVLTDTSGVEYPFPVNFPSAGSPIAFNINITTATTRANTRKIAFRNACGDTQFVVWLYDMETAVGLISSTTYKLTDSRTDGTGDAAQPFVSPDSAAVVVKAPNTTGYSNVVNFAAVPTGIVRSIWRQDLTIASQFHLVGTAAAGATTFTDAVYDVSSNVLLKEGRTQVPVGSTRPGVHIDGRVLLSVNSSGGTAWLNIATAGDPTTFPDYTLATIADAGLAFEPIDGCKMEVLGVGQVQTFSNIGADTGKGFEPYTLVHGTAGLRVLSGTQPDVPDTDPSLWFRLGHPIHIGLCGPHAICHVRDGIAQIDNNGDVIFIDRTLQPQCLSGDLAITLHNDPHWTGTNANRTKWELVADPQNQWLTLFAIAAAGQTAYSRIFRLDVSKTDIGWDELDPSLYLAPTAVATNTTGESGYAAIAGAGGVVKRLYDVAGTLTGWTYQTTWYNRTNHPGLTSQNRPMTLMADFTGTVQFYVYVRTGTTTTTVLNGVTPLTSTPFRGFPLTAGEALSIKAVGAAGSTLRHMELQVAPRIV